MGRMSPWTMTGIAIAIGLAGGVAYYLVRHPAGGEQAAGTKADVAAEQAVPVLAQPLDVKLTRTYQCGVKDEEAERWADLSLQQLLERFAGWEVVSADGTSVTLHKWENDIAPLCKENGRFGLLPDGTLALFNGLPEHGNVIQTFYPINTARMEASLPKEEVELLRKGIRVRDLAEYNSVLSTYGEFQSGQAADVSDSH